MQQLPHKFTGKERDSESNLDMFGARYYSSSLGRFMTPDWATKPISVPYADFGDRQTLNLYGYVRNNPLSKADADGHCYPWCTVIGGAIIGGVIGGGGEIIAAKLHGQSVDWKKVEGSALKGAVTGAAIGLAGPEAGKPGQTPIGGWPPFRVLIWWAPRDGSAPSFTFFAKCGRQLNSRTPARVTASDQRSSNSSSTPNQRVTANIISNSRFAPD